MVKHLGHMEEDARAIISHTNSVRSKAALQRRCMKLESCSHTPAGSSRSLHGGAPNSRQGVCLRLPQLLAAPKGDASPQQPIGRLLASPNLQLADSASQEVQLGSLRSVSGDVWLARAHTLESWPRWGVGCRLTAGLLPRCNEYQLNAEQASHQAAMLADLTCRRSISEHTFLSLTFDSTTLLYQLC